MALPSGRPHKYYYIMSELFFLIILSTTFAFAETTYTPEIIDFDKDSVSLPREEDCSPLKPGESLVINENSSESPTKVDRKYRLTRDKRIHKKYKIEVRLNFLFSDFLKDVKYPLNMSDQQLAGALHDRKFMNKMWNDKVNRCLKKHNHKLRSKDGIQLEIENVTSPSLPTINVDIKRPENKPRVDSLEWNSQTDCETIVHEVMHYLGLVDGYTETDMANHNLKEDQDKRYSRHKYDCRFEEPAHSVMNKKALLNTDSYTVENGIQCKTSDPKNKGVRYIMDENANSCIENDIKVKDYKDTLNLSKWYLGSDRYLIITKQETMQVNEVLFPAHTRLITQPHCYSKNFKYISCAQNAYRTHAEEGCLELRKRCQNHLD